MRLLKKGLSYYIFLFVVLSFFNTTYSQNTLSPNTDYITGFGKMWTFDDLPLDYFKDAYGFEPTEEWIEKLQKSALQFSRGCSGGFLSEDGLIMTNHHCARYGLLTVQKEDEDLFKTGFYAETLEDERRIEGLYVDQLTKIVDVTDEIIAAMDNVKNTKEKIDARNQMINELEANYAEESGLIVKVVTLYNGAKYSMYLYKRYNDIRVVMAPTFQIASTGWDWDNFTYPRYELDFMFLRAYGENGEPAEIENYFSFNPDGAEPGEPIFIIGRPGDTDRQVSVSELKWQRDVRHPFLVMYLNHIYDAYYEMYHKYPERQSELLNSVMSVGNSRKSYYGGLIGLQNEELMDRKVEFENQLKEEVKSDPELDRKYGHVWKALATLFEEKTVIGYKEFLYSLLQYRQPEYLSMAFEMYHLSQQLNLSEAERDEMYKPENLETTLKKTYPEDFDEELNKKLLGAFVASVYHVLGASDPMTQRLFDGKRGDEAVEYLLANSFMENRAKFLTLIDLNGDQILNSGDPFIQFIKETRDELTNLQRRNKELDETQQILNQELGRAIVELYGDRIPPDATLTLRLSDGVIKGYEYNGTLAPPKTTYFGLYDRYYSFGQKTYPWGLPDKWKTVPEKLDLSTPLNFAATLDIVGGNSGSSIVDINGEVIGLVFDGNLESLAGDYLYMPGDNRAVAVDSKGLIEALKNVYKTDRLVYELLNSKLP